MKKKLMLGLGAAIVIIGFAVLAFQMQRHLQVGNLNNIDTRNARSITANLPKDILNEIGQNRFSSMDDSENVLEEFRDKYLYDYEQAPPPIDYIEVEAAKYKEIYIEPQSAIDDVEYLFNCLKYGYAGYEYFGGDAKFTKAKNQILSWINTYSEKVPCGYLEDEIFKNLDFIQDGHFSIGRKNIIKKHNMFISEEYEIEKREDKYYIKNNNDSKQIISVNDKEPASYIKPSINKDGFIVYRLCSLEQTEDSEIIVEVKLERDVLKVKLDNLRNNYKSRNGNDIYSYKELYNVPIIKLSSFVPSKQLEEFVSQGKQMQDKDILIIDIRGNSGGDSSYALNWIRNFTGVNYEDSVIDSSLCTDLAKKAILYAVKQAYDPKYYPEYEKFVREQYDASGSQYKYWSKVEIKPIQRIKNDTPIFVLMDMKTASSGESFITALRDLDNTFFVGTNSSGVGDIGNMAVYVLPNTKINAQFGSTIFLNNDLKMRDGLGWEPDFWVEPKDAETRLLRFIYNYTR